jgi:uncharacterized protein YjbI with pentapeptide repeats
MTRRTMRRVRWMKRASVLGLLLGCLLLPQAAASQVFVRATAEHVGQGVLRGRGKDCLVLTPAHVIAAGTPSGVAIVGTQGVEAVAEVLRKLDGDLALLALKPGSGLVCEEWLPLVAYGASIESQTKGHLSSRDDRGGRQLMPVTIRHVDQDTIIVRPATAGDQILQGMSGASLIVNGAFAGMLLTVEADEGQVLRLDQIMRLTEPFFAPGAAPPPALMDLTLAQATLDRAIRERDGSSQGQGEAIAAMVARGQTFNGANWSGVSLRGAALAKGSFTKMTFRMSDFTEVVAPDANFTQADLALATLDRAQMPGVTMTNSYAAFITASNVNWQGADLSQSDFYAGSLRGARLDKAKLRGTSFAFADLRGAVFDGADLTGAVFTGAILDKTTSFVNATIADVDFLGADAASAPLTPAQRAGTCYHPRFIYPDERGFQWTAHVLERWPSTRFDSGLDFDDLVQEMWYFSNFTDRSLAVCQNKAEHLEAMSIGFPSGVKLHVDRVYVAKGGRRDAVQARVKEHLALLKTRLRPENILKGSGAAQSTQWSAFMTKAAASVRPVSEPYLAQDQLVLIALKAGAVKEADLDWPMLTRERHYLEDAARKDGLQRHSMWPALFPPDAPTIAPIHADAAATYRAWTLARMPFAGTRLVAKRSLAALERRRTEKGVRLSGVLPSHLVAREYAEAELAWRQRGDALLKSIAVPPAQVAFPVRTGAPTKRGPILLVLSAPVSDYAIAAPVSPDVPDDAILEVDLTIERVVPPPAEVPHGIGALVYVTPGKARVRAGERIVWNGVVTRSAPTEAR